MATFKKLIVYGANNTKTEYDIAVPAASNITQDSTHRFTTDTEKFAWNNKANELHSHTTNQITDFPHSLPANGGDSYTVNGHTVASDVPSGAKFTDTIYGLATTSADGLMSKDHFTKLNNINTSQYVTKSSSLSIFLLSTGWYGNTVPYSNTINVPGATTNNNIEVMIANTCTVDEYEAWCSASIGCGTQTTNSITLKAFGDKPTINIPLTVIVRKDI